MHTHIVYLLLGSNMGDSVEQLKKATLLIKKNIGTIERQSSYYITKAWGITSQPDFLNQVLVIKSKLGPETILKTVLKIELNMGRKRTFKNAPRTIDIDILFYDKLVLQSKELTIPHPLIQERNFVLTPLNELSPQFKHPVLNKSVHRLLQTCKDRLAVQKITK